MITSTLPLMGLSVFLNVVLATRVLTLDRRIAAIQADGELQPGTKVDAFIGSSIDGETATVSFADSSLPTVLYVMRPSCVWCKRNESNLRSLAEQAPGRYRLLMLSLDSNGLKEYQQEHNVSIPIVTDIPGSARDQFMMGGTPQTTMVSPTGVVLHNWMGFYNSKTGRQISATLGVALPGLDADAPSQLSAKDPEGR